MIIDEDHETEPVRPLLNITHFKKQVEQIRKSKLQETEKTASKAEVPTTDKNTK